MRKWDPWDVIEGALARRRPPRDQAWLAQQLSRENGRITEQAISNWKRRGVPSSRYAALADLLGLTMEQVAGREAPPWEQQQGEWPFPDIDAGRYMRLTDIQKGEIQAEVRRMIERFESQRTSGLGKSSDSQFDVNPRKVGSQG